MDTSLSLQSGVQAGLAAPMGESAAPVRGAERLSGAAPRIHESRPGATALVGGGYAQLRARQDDMNELARTVRQGSSPVEVRKLFPPYPPEQEARMAYLDQISGMRKQIEALMFVMGQPGGKGETDAQANALAKDISQNSRQLLAGLPSQQAISMNRPLLEVVAQIDPVQ